MPKCVYCGRVYDIPHGLTLVMVDGTINHLCSSKCRKNLKMKRRKVRWVSKQKQMTAAELKKEISAEVAEEHKSSDLVSQKEGKE